MSLSTQLPLGECVTMRTINVLININDGAVHKTKPTVFCQFSTANLFCFVSRLLRRRRMTTNAGSK